MGPSTSFSGSGLSSHHDTCLDLPATNACQAATVKGCVVDGASAVEVAHAWKLHTYAARCEAKGLAFIPLAVDTFGDWHPTALGSYLALGPPHAGQCGRAEF